MLALGLGAAALAAPTTLLSLVATADPAAPAAGFSWTLITTDTSETYFLHRDGQLAGSSNQSFSSIRVADSRTDGLGQRTYWRVGTTGPWKTCVNDAGKGTERSCPVPTGRTIEYRYCLKDGPVDVACAPRDSFRSVS
jgi:hypothetical protein